MDDHSDRIKVIERRLNEGDTAFALLRRDISGLGTDMQRLAALVEQAMRDQGTRWGAEVGKAAIFWAVPLIGGGVLWSIMKSGGIHP